MKTRPFSLLIAFCILAVARFASGYFIGPAPSLEKLAAEADLIFKGEVIGTEPVQDKWFEPVEGFAAHETRFKVVSQIKGEPEGVEVRFRHYDKAAGGNFFDYTPQFYHFEPGKTYVVCAHLEAGATRQLRAGQTSNPELGVLRCRDQRPVTAKTLPEIFWAELIALRDSAVPADVVYAIAQWNKMSESPEGSGIADFSRLEVLNAIRGLISRPEPEIAQAAIRTLGAGSPYLSDDLAPFWLGTIGVPNGLGQMDPGVRNAGGALTWREIAAVANSKAPPETRALAIRALGLVKAGEIQQMMDPWINAPEPAIRAAAVMLSTDFAAPDPYTTEVFTGFANDPAPAVRKCAAYAIGFMQDAAIVPVLSKLLKDEAADVRRAAAESLHSFRPQIPTVATALKTDLKNPETQPLSVLALARDNPGAHLDDLARIITENTTPTNWTGGQIPAFTAWKLLFKFLRAQPAADVRSGKWDHYLDVMEKVGQYGSSEPQYVYAFYLQRGLPKRAAQYRTAAKKAVSYDMDYYFNMVDQNPKNYQGE